MINQGTYEWYRDRFGRITMSERVDTIISGNPHQLNNLLDTIRWEQLVREDEAHIKREFERECGNAERVESLKWGREKETEALAQYELMRNIDVHRPEFKRHDMWEYLVGDSTDFLETVPGKDDLGNPMQLVVVGEVKCYLNTDNHLRALRYGMDSKHYNQVQGHMECWGVRLAKFISYDPRVQPVDKQIYQQLVQRDEQWSLRFRTRMQEFERHLKNRTRFDFGMSGARDGIPSLF